MRDRLLVAVLTASALLAGCSGGGGGGGSSLLPGGGSGGSGGSGSGSGGAAQAQSAIADANALGSPIKAFSDFDKASATAGSATTSSRARVQSTGSGACNNGVEFFVPDKNGDANSTETIDFYDSGCSLEARDLVRIFNPTSASSETVDIHENFYAPLNTTPIATRTETHTISNATFNANGFPIAANGYDLVASSLLNIASARTIASGSEFVLAPASGATNNFCSDSAGYNATGFARLGETFGWQGGVNGGTRTVNSDNSVTWTATHAGSVFKGPIGGLSINAGTQNTACPISTPMFTLAGGTSIGTYSIPVTATYLHGMLESLTIQNATLANGDTLNVTTNSSQSPQSSTYITGVVSNAGTQIATFGVDAFGDGTLTVTKTGAQYVITDWHVVR